MEFNKTESQIVHLKLCSNLNFELFEKQGKVRNCQCQLSKIISTTCDLNISE